MIGKLEGEDIFRILFESAGEGLILSDERGTLLVMNPRIQEMFGYENDELIGKKVEVLIPESRRDQHIDQRNGYVAHPKKRPMGKGIDLSGRRKDGSVFPIEISLNYFYSGGEMVVMGLITDVTERKRIEKKFQQLNIDLEQRVDDRTQMLAGAIKELEYSNQSLEKAEEDLRRALETEKELSELKSRFVSTASHEFRTPLATILSSVSLIAKYNKPEDEEKRAKHIERIKSSVDNLRDILNDFLSLSRLEEGKVGTIRVQFDIIPFCEAIREEMQFHTKPGQEIRYEHRGVTEITQDNQLLKSVLVNLLSNAIKFSEEGKPICMKSDCIGEELRIRVIDHGIGMPVEDQKHLFERFFRAENAASIQGTGLGLNIVLKYVELMGGKISFQSELGKGSVFQITFPL